MNSTKNYLRRAARTLVLSLLGFALSSNALADNYRVKIKTIRPEAATGDVIIQVKPGTNEKNFTGKARVMLVDGEPGTNRLMATLLTAVSLNTEVIINVTNPPSYEEIQTVISTSLIAP